MKPILVLCCIAALGCAPQPQPTPADPTVSVLVPPKCDNPDCTCDPCRCENCKCKPQVEPEPEPEPQPYPEPDPLPQPKHIPTLHPIVVVECLNPACDKHGTIVTQLEHLKKAGWQFTVLCTKLEPQKVAELGFVGDAFPYCVLQADGTAAAATYFHTAQQLGDWLNRQAKERGGRWAVGSAFEASNLCSAVVISGGDRCPPCKRLERDKPNIERDLGAALEVIHDTDPAAKEFRAGSVPTTIVFLSGKEVARTAGYEDRMKYVQWLRDAAAKCGGRWK